MNVNVKEIIDALQYNSGKVAAYGGCIHWCYVALFTSVRRVLVLIHMFTYTLIYYHNYIYIYIYIYLNKIGISDIFK